MASVIETKINRLASAKAAIKSAIEGKGVTVPDATLLDGMASLIESIQAGGATEPYIEETYDSSSQLVSATLHGHTITRTNLFYKCSTLSSVIMPSGIESIGGSSFYGCSSLALTRLPSGITRISDSSFYGCSSLALTRLPSGIRNIYANAFYGCKSLVSITFEGKPNSIYSSAFKNCTNLTTINVPWAEGEVKNAPWGATNATINYNYTGG